MSIHSYEGGRVVGTTVVRTSVDVTVVLTVVLTMRVVASTVVVETFTHVLPRVPVPEGVVLGKREQLE